MPRVEHRLRDKGNAAVASIIDWITMPCQNDGWTIVLASLNDSQPRRSRAFSLHCSA